MAKQFSNESFHELPLAGSVQTNLLLESFLPGFSIISDLLARWGIDVSSYVTILLVLSAAAAWLIYSALMFGDILRSHFISTVTIRMDDEAYNFIMTWVAKQPFSQTTHQFVASTKVASDFVDSDSDDDSDQETDEEYDNLEVLDTILDQDFRGIIMPWAFGEKMRRLMWTPSIGTHFFRYQNQILAFSRIRDEKQQCFGGSRTEEIQISCIGRSTVILKELMKEAQKAYLEKDKKKTVIYRSTIGEDGMYWSRCMSRTPRPISTVILDISQKQTFVNDVKLYLHPRTRRWYANRGIPYRRGYMFHGLPGTGKTSLAFSVAGLFNLKIYMVNLNSNALTEDGLAALFQRLPRKCILLLEDVDAAGMTASRHSETKKGTCSTIDDLGKCVKDEFKNSKEGGKKAGISLSGLLNVIDGVAAQEGRILIMTTNHLDHLDPALIRPGRVDFSIKFGHADSATAEEIFCRVYSQLEDDIPMRQSIEISTSSDGSQKLATPKGLASKASTTSSQLPMETSRLSQEQLLELSSLFSKHIPTSTFTPAEIQGYLLLYWQNPWDAVANVEDWVKKTIDTKALGKDEEVQDSGVDGMRKRKRRKRRMRRKESNEN